MFSPYSLTLPGGVQGQVLGLARALRRQGHVVRVLGPCDGPPPESGVTPLGNAIPLAANGSVAPIAPDPAAALRTIRVLNDEEFDVLHLHEPLVPGPNLTALLYKPAPILGTFHAAGRSSSYRLLQRPLAWGAKKLDLRVAVSADAEALAKTSLGGSYMRLFNGVDTNRFLEAKPAAVEGPTVLFVGRHEERKGLGVLLEAHAMMGPTVRLWIVGSGPQTGELKARFPSPLISWLGAIDDATLASYWTGATVYCAPSLGGESFGVVLLESMAAGTPVVASDIDGYRSVARHEQDGLLVAPGDATALAQSLERLLEDSTLAEGLRDRGLVRAAEFSMDTLATRYGELYETIRRR
jgi:phosphatidyl-myo-inositol alpha-mannosyltransferase